MENSNDILVFYKKILLVERIKKVDMNEYGHRFWFDKKGVYKRESNAYPIMISYSNNEYKTFFPESQTFRIYCDNIGCYIYEHVLDCSNGNYRYVFHSMISKGKRWTYI